MASKRMRLGAIFSVVLVCAVVLAMGLYVVFAAYQRDQQAEERLYAQAVAFAEEMDAVWSFFDVNQNKINYNSDGAYDFKGLYCSIVGKGIGAIFTQNSDYAIRYTGTNVRNRFDMPDEFETKALEVITDVALPDEYYAMTDYDGEPAFRYVRGIYLEESCLQCHGGPKGELDITGYPKEGLEVGDFAGAISIVIPADSYVQNEQQALILSLVFFVFILVLVCLSVFLAIDRFVTRPVSKLSAIAARVGDGDLSAPLDDVRAYGEIDDLVKRFSDMATQLNEAYTSLEMKVSSKTEEIRRKNEALERQRLQLAESNELLRLANESLSTDNQYKDDFLAVMSHELRTPLTAILTFVEILDREERGSSKEIRAIKELKSNTLTLLNMVNDTLEMAAMQADRGRMVEDDVDLVDVTNHVETTMSVLAEKKDIGLFSYVGLDVPIIRGDWDRICHAMENLVSNAIKFTCEGGSVEIKVFYDSNDDTVVVSVSDTGIGISEDDLPRIFEKFTQIDASTARGYNGSGLGLSVVKDIAERHGGTVLVESKLGAGSVFSMTLPAHSRCLRGGSD